MGGIALSITGVIYARYSTDNQREESIEGQLRICMEYAEREGITLMTPYIDRAYSARTDNRPAFLQMIKDSHKKLFDVVIVYKLDRFARNMNDATTYKAILKKNGVQVMSATEAISSNADGILMEAVLIGMAEYYSAELSEKISRGHHDNALKFKCNGGPRTFGLIVDEDQYYQIDPVKGPIVLDMFLRYDRGETMADIAKHLNRQGVRSIKGNCPNTNFVSCILRNKKFAGFYVYDDVCEEDAIPAIVPKDLFFRVQEKLDKSKRVSAKFKAHEKYLLSSKLFCGDCGTPMAGECGRSRNGEMHHYYKCSRNKRRKGCSKKAVKKNGIETLVVNRVKHVLMDDKIINQMADIIMEMQSKENQTIPYLKKQLAETEKGITNMLNAIEQGIFTASTKGRLDELEERKSLLETSILNEEMTKSRLTREQIIFWLYRFRKLNTKEEKQRKRLIDGFVNSVYVFDDRLVIAVNFKEDAETVSLDLLNSLGDDIMEDAMMNPSLIPLGDALGFVVCWGDAA